MAGKVALVTGATSGIGLETARALARMGAHVVIGARDEARGRSVAAEIGRSGGSAEVLPVDLASFESVRRAADRFLAAHPSLEVLVNNAGTAVRRRQLSPDGHELTWATNFLGHFLLTRLQLPALRRAPRPRVVNVASAAHATARIPWDDLELERSFGPFRAYARSKLAQVLFTRELARREPGVGVNAVHPGTIGTGIWREVPAPLRWLLGAVLPRPGVGAVPVVRLASSPELDGVSGRYFDRLRERRPAPAGRDDADAARLWDVAEQATR
ncbi:MAG TPA: SDR family oxidoreductase [Anaeromyxobacteraceae bacterium]|jgi:NAD(P)-dependent dehydrogenase (short-subunit alcohol dehydrogenase family)